MSDLHERLLHRLEGAAPDHEERVEAAVRAVVELHKPEPTHPGPLSTLVCHGCELDGYDAEHPPWPCWTIKAIAAALGVDGG